MIKEKDIRNKDIHNKLSEVIERCNEDYTDTYEKISCISCNEKEYNFQFSKWGFDFVSCVNCNTLYVNPRPSFENLKNFYKDIEYINCQNNLVNSGEKTRRKKMKERVDFILKRINNNSIIGDIGSGQGVFLEELRKQSPNNIFIAIEPSEESSKKCKEKGFEVKQTIIEDIDNMSNKFDCLISIELLEHIHNPKLFFDKIYNMLKPNGFIFITCLCLGFDIEILKENSKSVSPMQHINFFNVESIKNLLIRKGFENIEISTPGVLDCDIVENFFEENNIDYNLPWSNIEEKDNFQKLIQENNKSSHMWILAYKKDLK
jgi:SAM-dependent methyltransferase